MIDIQQLRKYVIQPPLKAIGLYSEGAEELLVATASIESRLGTFVRQENGPAVGLYQMEPNTYEDLIKNGIPNKEHLLMMIGFSFIPDALEMVTNMKLSTIMARLHYHRFPEEIPDKGDIEGIWNLYKKRWNTALGATTEKEFLIAYNNFSGRRVV